MLLFMFIASHIAYPFSMILLLVLIDLPTAGCHMLNATVDINLACGLVSWVMVGQSLLARS